MALLEKWKRSLERLSEPQGEKENESKYDDNQYIVDYYNCMTKLEKKIHGMEDP